MYFQEKDNIIKEIKLEESKQKLLSFVKKELNTYVQRIRSGLK